MKRGRFAEQDSFDMLLDAMTNAFGGILFLALLIVVLVGKSVPGKEASPANSAALGEALQTQRTIDELSAQLAGLETALAEQRTTEQALVDGDQAALLAQIGGRQRALDELLERQANVAERLAAAEQSLSALQGRLEEAAEQAAAAQQEQLVLERQLAELQRSQTRTAETPRLRLTDKREFSLVVRYGRVYVEALPWRPPQTREINLRDFLILDEQDDLVIVTPKPYAGLPLDERQAFAPTLRRDLAGLDPSESYIALVVWHDSFAEFAHLRSALVEWGFEYRIVPVDPGGSVVEAPAQETSVQ